MNDKDLLLNRYTWLIDLWSHHNSTQLQWPALVISAALIVISIVIPNQLPLLTQVNLWGVDTTLALGAGIPLVLAGLGIVVILYMMGRAQSILTRIELEIAQVEEKLGESGCPFRTLNHSAGLSGVTLVRLFIVSFLALPTILLGWIFIIGPIAGSVVATVIFLAWLMIEWKAKRPSKAL